MKDGATWCDLADLLQNPKLLEPPPVVVPRLAWQGRITLLAAREKAGKSTLAGVAAAAVVRGDRFLNERTPAGRVAWLALDEPLGDTVRRFHDLGLEGGVSIGTEPPDPTGLHDLLLGTDARLLVIDTLHCFALGRIEDMYRPEQWPQLFADLRQALRGTEAGILLLHHLKKAAPEFTGSQAIGAGVDVLLTLTQEESDPMVRKVRFSGRVHGEDFALRFDPTRFAFSLDQGTASLSVRVLAAVTREPGVGSNALLGEVRARRSDVLAALRKLEDDGHIENRGGKGGHEWHPRDLRSGVLRESTRNHSRTALPSGEGTGGNHAGTSRNHTGSTSGRGGGSGPYKVGGREPRSSTVRSELGSEGVVA